MDADIYSQPDKVPRRIRITSVLATPIKMRALIDGNNTPPHLRKFLS